MPGLSIWKTAKLSTYVYIDTSFGVTFARFTGRAVAMLSCEICICASPATFLGKINRNYLHISAVKHRRRKGYNTMPNCWSKRETVKVHRVQVRLGS
jgi:hypothetical protein